VRDEVRYLHICQRVASGLTLRRCDSPRG
jgi:hypothetical protein